MHLHVNTFSKSRNKNMFFSKTLKSFSTILCLTLLFLLFFISSSHQVSNFINEETSAYEILSDYNFPKGILPKGVNGYSLDKTSGKFSAFLNGSCSFWIEGSYQLKYKSTIKGFISRGRLSGLEGVSVKLFFMWADIIEVSRNGDDLDFSVGIAGAGFPANKFEESPQCGCGFSCVNDRKVSKLRSQHFVASS